MSSSKGRRMRSVIPEGNKLKIVTINEGSPPKKAEEISTLVEISKLQEINDECNSYTLERENVTEFCKKVYNNMESDIKKKGLEVLPYYGQLIINYMAYYSIKEYTNKDFTKIQGTMDVNLCPFYEKNLLEQLITYDKNTIQCIENLLALLDVFANVTEADGMFIAPSIDRMNHVLFEKILNTVYPYYQFIIRKLFIHKDYNQEVFEYYSKIKTNIDSKLKMLEKMENKYKILKSAYKNFHLTEQEKDLLVGLLKPLAIKKSSLNENIKRIEFIYASKSGETPDDIKFIYENICTILKDYKKLCSTPIRLIIDDNVVYKALRIDEEIKRLQIEAQRWHKYFITTKKQLNQDEETILLEPKKTQKGKEKKRDNFNLSEDTKSELDKLYDLEMELAKTDAFIKEIAEEFNLDIEEDIRRIDKSLSGRKNYKKGPTKGERNLGASTLWLGKVKEELKDI